MPNRRVTPYRPTSTIVTGHFRSGPRYVNWRPAGTGDWLLIYTLSGRGRFGGETLTRSGDVVLLPPHTPHDYRTDGPRWELLWTHFTPRREWQDWLRWPAERGVPRLTIEDRGTRRRVASRLADAHRAATGPLLRRDDLAMNALEEALLWCDSIHPRTAPATGDDRIRAAADWLCRNLHESVTLARLADEVGMSTSRLAHRFRDEMRVSPMSYLESQRMRRARQLLEVSPLSVKQIAAEVGFANPFYFTLRFNKAFGLSPTAFRSRRAIAR